MVVVVVVRADVYVRIVAFRRARSHRDHGPWMPVLLTSSRCDSQGLVRGMEAEARARASADGTQLDQLGVWIAIDRIRKHAQLAFVLTGALCASHFSKRTRPTRYPSASIRSRG